MKVRQLFERDEDTNDVPGHIVKNDDGSITAFDKLGNRKEFDKGQEAQAQQFANGAGATVLDESKKRSTKPTFIDSLMA